MKFVRNYALEVPKGEVDGMTSVNKFGRAPAGIQTTLTDVWDRANATPTQQIWVAPTQARLHNIKSSSASDDGDPVGVGARTVKIYGLTSWDEKEVSEIVILNGTTDVSTVNSYVIIHRMEVITSGATNINVGNITATAVTDGSVTAQINIGEGQTQMAIYGVPSVQTAYLAKYYFSFNKAGGATSFIDLSLMVNINPDVELTRFITKHTQGAQSNGSSNTGHEFEPYFKMVGPCIIKIQGIASAADIDGSAGFDMYLADN